MFDRCSHKVDRGKVMKFYPISITGTILLLSSVVVPIKHIWAEDSKSRTRQTKAHKLPTPSRAYRTINLHKFKSQFMARLLTNAYRHFWIKDMHKKRAYTKRQTHTHWHQGETGVRQDWLSLPVAPESILIFPTLLFLHTSLSCSRLHFLPLLIFFFSSLFLFFFFQNRFPPRISLTSFKLFTLWSDLLYLIQNTQFDSEHSLYDNPNSQNKMLKLQTATCWSIHMNSDLKEWQNYTIKNVVQNRV